MALTGHRADFDPLGAGGDDDFTTVFEGSSPPAAAAAGSGAAPAAGAAAAAGSSAPAEAAAYDDASSFMTARSTAASRMSNSAASVYGTGSAAAGAQWRAPAAVAPAAPVPSPYQEGLRFGDDGGQHVQQRYEGGGGGGGASSSLYGMPTDMYEVPYDPFAPAAAGGASTGAGGGGFSPPQGGSRAGALPGLYDFTRDFSQPLPVSDPDVPSSPPLAALGGGRSGSGGAAAVAALAPPRPAAGASSSSLAAAAAAAAPAPVPAAPPPVAPVGPDAVAAVGSRTSGVYAAAALLTNTVTVTSPRKALAPSRIPGISEPYTMYTVTSRGAGAAEAAVERRFRDVVALAELLAALYPGCFLPPRPARAAIEARRMTPAFVEERRTGIERFLRRLVVHPVMGPCEATQVWLRAPAPDLVNAPEWRRLQPPPPPGLARATGRLLLQVVGRERTVPSPLEVVRPAAVYGDMYRLLHERSAQMRGVLGRAQLPPGEESLREEAAQLQERSEGLVVVSRRADSLIARASKLAAVVGQLGGALGGMADAEAAGGGGGGGGQGRAEALRTAVDACSKVGKLYGVATDASAKHLSPLHDWLAAHPPAAAAMAAREGCLLTAAVLAADEAEARRRLAEAEARAGAGGGPAAQKKAEWLRGQVASLSASQGAAKDEYERVAARNRSELAAFKAHMSRELADAVREFALVQVAAAQRAHATWYGAAAALGAGPGELAAAAAALGPGVSGPRSGSGGLGSGAGGSGARVAGYA